jgi:hypothetical protein
MVNFLEKIQITGLRKIGKFNRPVMSTEIELAIKSFSYKERPMSRGLPQRVLSNT